ncbi:hypothetical protein ACQPZK_07015 [Micromonospora sp. CA-249363]|uniref:hypothetical protein n=1 Tax=Micromonospora sp. CA-249363 TaxID=3239963 RepID=UPI003D8E2CF5
MNVVSNDDLFIPDIAVLKVSGGGRTAMGIGHAVLLGEIVSPGTRRRGVIDRPWEYAAAKVPFFLLGGGKHLRDAGAVRVLHRPRRTAR